MTLPKAMGGSLSVVANFFEKQTLCEAQALHTGKK
jgi:hypothetical protein